MFVHLRCCPSVSLFVHLPCCPSGCLFVNLPCCPSGCLFVHLPCCPSGCLAVYQQSVCLAIGIFSHLLNSVGRSYACVLYVSSFFNCLSNQPSSISLTALRHTFSSGHPFCQDSFVCHSPPTKIPPFVIPSFHQKSFIVRHIV